MAMPAVSKNLYGLANLPLANVTTVTLAVASYLHARLKTLKGQNHAAYPNPGSNVAGVYGLVLPPSSAHWTVVSSSTGAVAGAGDNFSDVFAGAEWPNGTAGNAHAWFVLQSPAGLLDGPWYVLVSRDSATTTTWTESWSKTAFSGGTTTANPTNAGTVSTGTFAHFNTSSTVAGKTHCLLDANGNYWFLCSRDGAGLIETWDSFQQLEQNQPSGDVYRCLAYSGHSTSGLWSSVQSGGSISGTGIFGFHRNGAAVVSSQLLISGINLSGFTELNGINSDAECVKYGLVYSTLANNMAIRGYIPDLYQITTQLTNGSNHPNNVSPLWSAIGATNTGGKMAMPFPCTLQL